MMLEAITETADVVAPPDARHQPREGRPAILSNMTQSSSWLDTTHVKVYASGPVDGALGEDGFDGERCVVINRIPQLLLREAALAITRAWPLRPRLACEEGEATRAATVFGAPRRPPILCQLSWRTRRWVKRYTFTVSA